MRAAALAVGGAWGGPPRWPETLVAARPHMTNVPKAKRRRNLLIPSPSPARLFFAAKSPPLMSLAHASALTVHPPVLLKQCCDQTPVPRPPETASEARCGRDLDCGPDAIAASRGWVKSRLAGAAV